MIFGGNWLARIGVLALFIGIAFFIKFAIDKGWLGPAVRIVLGIITGLGMIGGGYFWRKRYPTLSQTLSGGGIALLYLCIFAAFAFFQMLNVYVAVAMLFLICAGSAAIAFSYDSLPLALIGIIVAYGAPFVLGLGNGGGGAQAVAGGTWPQLLIYVLAVDLGVIYISRFRNWQWFTLLAFFGSLVTYAGWYGLYGHNGSLLLTEGSLTVLFLIFIGVVLLNNMRKKAPIETDLVLLVVNGPVYLFASYALMGNSLRPWLGAFTLALSAFYALFGVLLTMNKRTRALGVVAFVIALAALTIAVPVQFKEGMWTTILWAVEFVILAWAALRLKLSWMMGFGMLAFVLMGIKLLRFDSVVDISTYQPVLNSRVLVFIAGIAASYLVAYLIKSAKEKDAQWVSFTSVLFVAANFLTLLVLSLELWGYFAQQISNAGLSDTAGLKNMQNLLLTALWAGYAMILLVIGISKRWRQVRIWALALLVVPIAKVFLYDVWALQTLYRIVAFVGLGILLIMGGYLYQRNSKRIIGFFTDQRA